MTTTATELRSWTAVGAQDSAQRTYSSVKKALEGSSRLSKYTFEIFLQGSYANDTNTRGDSDVDIVAKLKSSIMPDTSRLSSTDKANYQAKRSSGTVRTVQEFRSDVLDALSDYYGARRVQSKDKCVKVSRTDGYVDADVVPCYEYRAYTKYPLYGDPEWVEGVWIEPLSGGHIVNYPKRHRENGSDKNAKTHGQYKPTVRQMKRLRRRAVEQGAIRDGAAPGYLLECLTFNSPNSLLAGDDSSRLPQVMTWLSKFDAPTLRAEMMSGDGIHTLFGTDPGKHDPNLTVQVLQAMYRVL